MPRIIIDCPTTGEAVPTGHRAQGLEVGAMTEPRSFRCPVCHQVHSWTGADARVEGSPAPEAQAAPAPH